MSGQDFVSLCISSALLTGLSWSYVWFSNVHDTMSILEMDEVCSGEAQSKDYCRHNLHVPDVAARFPPVLGSPQTSSMRQVRLAGKHFTGLELRHLEDITG